MTSHSRSHLTRSRDVVTSAQSRLAASDDLCPASGQFYVADDATTMQIFKLRKALLG